MALSKLLFTFALCCVLLMSTRAAENSELSDHVTSYELINQNQGPDTYVAEDGSGWKIRFTIKVVDPNDPWSGYTCTRIEWYHPTKKMWYDAEIIEEYMEGPTAMRAIVKSKDSGKYYSYEFNAEGAGGVTEYNGKFLTYEDEPDSQVRQKDDASKLARHYKSE